MPDTADPATEKKEKDKPHRDPAREVVETVVFVVVLVLLLKLFVTEAFVIPTGSMAETLYGYQKMVTCPKCGHEFPVNDHDEVEGNQQTGRKMPLVGFTCPNCRYMGHVNELQPAPQPRTGDRVLVLKPLYHIIDPHRGDVVVFKYPEKPQEKHTAQNYIKRCMAFGGETLAVYRGELFVTTSLSYPADERDEDGKQLYPRPDDPLDLWKPKYMYPNHAIPGQDVIGKNPRADDLFKASRDAGFPGGRGGFEIVRKGEEQVLADRRIVWDNDKQPKELAGKVPPRWYAPAGDEAAWKGDDQQQPRAFAHSGDGVHWVRYRHLDMPWNLGPPDRTDPIQPSEYVATNPDTLGRQSPKYIDNFLGYNAGRDLDPATGQVVSREGGGYDRQWVGDLTLECEVEVGSGGEVILELSRGINRFQATFGNGKVKLARTGPGGPEFGNPERPCKVTAGRYKLRFANVDARLWVWVDDKRVDFGTEGDYQPPTPAQENEFRESHRDAQGQPDFNPEGWTYTNDVMGPASIGAKGQVTVRNIRLDRDVYYTRTSPSSDPAKADIFYVQPKHYMCLGDNSAQSSDSRRWGTVPERLMLGKAVFVFFPVGRVGFIK
jgi:signal peptidase I